MRSGILNVSEWSDLEFSGAALGDVRREKRLLEVAAAPARNPSGTPPAAWADGTDLKAGYRLLEIEAVNHAHVSAPHFQRVREVCRSPGAYLLIEDPMELDFTS